MGWILLLVLLSQYQWQLVGTMPHPRWGGAAVLVGDNVYILGGESESGFVPFVDVFNLELQEWDMVDVTPIMLRDFAAVVHNNRIYIFGGRNEQGEASPYIIVIGMKNRWLDTLDVSFPVGVFGGVVTKVGEYYYYIGGMKSDGTYVDSIFEVDLVNETIRTVGAFNGVVFASATGWRPDGVTISGGIWYDYLRTVSTFYPLSGMWRSEVELPEPRAYHCSFVVDSTLFVAGGIVNDSVTATVACCNYYSSSWEYSAPMAYARADFMSVKTEDGFYVFGGFCYQNGIRCAVPYVEKFCNLEGICEECRWGSRTNQHVRIVGCKGRVCWGYPAEVKFFATDGRELLRISTSGVLDLSQLGLSTGIYLLVVEGKDSKLTERWLFLR